jgi:hypothetical protein
VKKIIRLLCSFVGVIMFAVPTPVAAQAARGGTPKLTDQDRMEIQDLVSHYASALGSCSAEAFADLFAPVTGTFASGFRGQIVGHDTLVALVQSEPHCATTTPGRPAGNGPAVLITESAEGVTGVADLGNAGHYEDVYVKTPKGWRFQSRNVITKKEADAHFTSKDFIAVRRLAGTDLGVFDDVYRDTPVGRRLRSSGVVVNVTPEGATGRAVLRVDGGRYDDVYVRTATGWRFKSRTYVAPEGQ